MTALHQNLPLRLEEGPLVGTFVGLSSPSAVEILGWTGFDLLCLDAEHSAFGVTDLQEQIRAADVTGTPALVRIPELGQDLGRVLDWGAAGVVVPRVETAAQAREAVSRARYPSTGTRGAGPGRATRYGATMGQYLANANDHVLVVLQVETSAGVSNVDEIAAVEGVDVIFVGPGDLAVSLGTSPGSEVHTAAISTILTAAANRGVTTGIFCSSPEQVEKYTAEGVRLFLIGADVVFLAQGAAQTLQTARASIREAALVSAQKVN